MPPVPSATDTSAIDDGRAATASSSTIVADAGAVGDGGVGRVRQRHGEGLGRLDGGVGDDRHGDGLAWSSPTREGERAAAGGVVAGAVAVPLAVAKPTVTVWVGLADRLTVKFADLAPPVPSVTVTSLIDSAGSDRPAACIGDHQSGGRGRIALVGVRELTAPGQAGAAHQNRQRVARGPVGAVDDLLHDRRDLVERVPGAADPLRVGEVIDPRRRQRPLRGQRCRVRTGPTVRTPRPRTRRRRGSSWWPPRALRDGPRSRWRRAGSPRWRNGRRRCCRWPPRCRSTSCCPSAGPRTPR